MNRPDSQVRSTFEKARAVHCVCAAIAVVRRTISPDCCSTRFHPIGHAGSSLATPRRAMLPEKFGFARIVECRNGELTNDEP